MKLYSFSRSSAAYRVRIALALKGLSYEYASVNLPKGAQYQPEYSAINPQNLVPVLDEGNQLLYQSLAIIQYLDEVYPEPPLLPQDAFGRSRVRSLALVDRPAVPQKSSNATGDSLETDGKMAVMVLQ